MALVTMPPGQLLNMINCCKGVEARIPANGIPELDKPFNQMIKDMEAAYAVAIGKPLEKEE